MFFEIAEVHQFVTAACDELQLLNTSSPNGQVGDDSPFEEQLAAPGAPGL